jgi:hypothetical protein
MQKSQLFAVIVITTLIATMFAAYSINNFASAAIITPSIDPTATSHQSVHGNNPTSITISTSTTQEIIYASLYGQTSGRGFSISSSPSLTWHYRGGGNTSSSNGEIAAWWAVSATAQSITISFTSSGNTGGCIMSAFSVKDADPTSPFDPNLSSAGFNHATSGSASSSISTTNQNALVVGVVGIATNKAITAATGYTQIDNTGTSNSPSGADEYLAVTTQGTYTPTFAINLASSAWVEVADAFSPAKQSLTITSSPQTGSGFITVDSSAQTTPYSNNWTPGTVLSLSAVGTVSGGAGRQYVFSSWSDGGGQTHSYTVQSASETVTANYQTQYQVTFTQTGLDGSTTAGTVLTVNGTSVQYSSLPYNVWVNSGDRLVYTYSATVSSTTSGKQFALGTVTPASPLTGIVSASTVTATYQIKYQVSFAASPSGSGTINQADGYFNTGSTAIAASAAGGYIFDHWSSTGSITFGNTLLASTTMTVSGAGTVTANFVQSTHPTSLTISTSLGSVDSGNHITITGTLTSSSTGVSGKTIVLSYFDGSQWQQIGTTTTQGDGTYQYDWTVPATLPNGQYSLRADFAGDTPYLASTSTVSGNDLSLIVLPEYSFGGIIGIVACLAAMLLFINRKKVSQKLGK